MALGRRPSVSCSSRPNGVMLAMADDMPLRLSARKFAAILERAGRALVMASRTHLFLDDDLQPTTKAAVTADEIDVALKRELGITNVKVANCLRGAAEMAALAEEAMGLTLTEKRRSLRTPISA